MICKAQNWFETVDPQDVDSWNLLFVHGPLHGSTAYVPDDARVIRTWQGKEMCMYSIYQAKDGNMDLPFSIAVPDSLEAIAKADALIAGSQVAFRWKYGVSINDDDIGIP